MRITYEPWKPGAQAKATVAMAARICADYAAQGYDLTLRQLYYQFVARGLIENTQRSYKNLGNVINKARMAGLLDWDYINDRTRNLQQNSHWGSPAGIISGAARGYGRELWADQPTRVEVWVEKEALAGVISQVADRNDCPWFSCRGYVSQSEMWAAGQRIGQYLAGGQNVVVLHLGDHDPSGIDMSRDITDRIRQFVTQDWLNAGHVETTDGMATTGDILQSIADRTGFEGPRRDVVEVRRIALNMDQVEEYDPPPNPTKLTDSRSEGYLELHGDESWELDALDPSVLDQLVQDHIDSIVNAELMADAVDRQETERYLLTRTSRNWAQVAEFVESL